MSTTRLFIVGGGPAAVSMCLQVVEEYRRHGHKSAQPLEISVFEKGDKIGPGLPYSKSDDCYILNLPKDMMEPVHGTTGRFTEWLKSRPGAPQDTAFPPRRYFGEYLHFLAKKAQIDGPDVGVSIKYYTQCEVIDVESNGDQVGVLTSQGHFVGDYMVFCTGHMPSSTYSHFIGKSGYSHNPWDEQLYKKLDSNSDVTVIGTRLTAIDTVLRLFSSGHRGKVSMVSRSGMLPTVLSKEIPRYTLKYLTLENFDLLTKSHLLNLSLEDLAKLFFAEVNEAEGSPLLPHNIVRSYKDLSPEAWLKEQIVQSERGPKRWQQVLFATYPIVSSVWGMLNTDDKKIFIEHYRSIFLSYLAAFPLENAYKIQNHLASGQLSIQGGVTDIVPSKCGKEFSVHFENRSAFPTKQLINATGPGYDAAMDPLYKRLLAKGLIEKHDAGAINVDPITCQIISPTLGKHPRIFGVGEITWGSCLATTDMSRVAIQSSRVALILARNCLQPSKLQQPILLKNKLRVSSTDKYYKNFNTFFNKSISSLKRPGIMSAAALGLSAAVTTGYPRSPNKL